MLPSQKILMDVQESKKTFRNWMLPMAWFQFFTNRYFYEIVFIKKFPHNFECWNRPKPLLSRPTPPPVTRLLPSHSSSRPTPPPAPFFLPSHAANRHSGHPDVHSSVWNQPMIDFKQMNASSEHPDAHSCVWNQPMIDFKMINASAAHPDDYLSLWNHPMIDFKEITENDN